MSDRKDDPTKSTYEMINFQYGVDVFAMAEEIRELRNSLRKTWHELNIIRARSGVPYDSDGIKSDVDEKYFSSIIDEAGELLSRRLNQEEKK